MKTIPVIMIVMGGLMIWAGMKGESPIEIIKRTLNPGAAAPGGTPPPPQSGGGGGGVNRPTTGPNAPNTPDSPVWV